MKDTNDARLALVLRLADDHLILGHRVSEWCGHAPMLEEDLAMPNMALDLIGQARSLYQYAAELEGKGRTEDDLAYMRRERDYTNCLMVERPNGDFAHTMLRQLYFAAYMEAYWTQCLASTDETIRAIAAKAIKEVAYHIRHAGEWVIRLGDGTEESARRMVSAFMTARSPSVKATAPASLSKPISVMLLPAQPLVKAAIGCTRTIAVSRARREIKSTSAASSITGLVFGMVIMVVTPPADAACEVNPLLTKVPLPRLI